MYPYLRLASLFFRGIFAKKKPFQPLETQTWSFRPGIGDIDVYLEINNGRHFVFFDLARYDLAIRMGLYKWVRKTKSAFVVAGSSIRYMHRVKPWRKSKVKTKLVGMDEHFFFTFTKKFGKETKNVLPLLFGLVSEKRELYLPKKS